MVITPSQPARRALAGLVILMLFLGMANIGFTIEWVGRLAGVVHRQDRQATVQAATIGQLRAQQLAACAFAADVGSVPLPASPRPSKLGVSLIADSRAQWRKLHCPGQLPVPPGLAKWAAYYHVPAR